MNWNRLQVAKQKALRHFNRRFPDPYMRDDEWRDRTLRMMRKTVAHCSGWCCGNPRKWYGNSREGKTAQERRHET